MNQLNNYRLPYPAETVTPSIAKEWLELMVENQRTVSQGFVDQYAREMRKANWKVAAPLIFNIKGQLIDGQHRLLAVIKADIPVDFAVMRGLPEEAIDGLDMGKKRTVINLASLQGHTFSSRHTAIANACYLCPCEDYLFSRNFSTTSQEKIDTVTKHYEAINFVAHYSGRSPARKHSAMIAPVARAWYSTNHQRLREFLYILETGMPVSSNVQEDQAAIYLRDTYLLERSSPTSKGGGVKYSLFLYRRATTALRRFLDRENVKVLRTADINPFPVNDFDEWWIQRRKMSRDKISLD